MELNDEKSKLDLFKTKVNLFADLNGVLDHENSPYFSRDWIADLLGFNKNIIRKEKINKIYE